MPKTDAYGDEEVSAFLDQLPRHLTFTEMAAACLKRFGADRAWSQSKILRYWEMPHRRAASRVDLDNELPAFLDDLVGRL